MRPGIRHALAAQLALAAFLTAGCSTTAPAQRPVATPSAPQPLPADATLQFSELFASGGSELEPSDTAQQLVGKRVRMVGFMAELEHGPIGAFYLTAQPVRCDESGAGTADLPLESVKVAVPFAADKPIPHIAGPIEVIGAFDIGGETDAQGFPSSFRLRLDQNPNGSAAKATQLSAVSHR